jgi:hypothetical protein
MGYVSLAMQETGFTKDEINSYRIEAMSGDYDNLLCVSMKYIDKCNERKEINQYWNGNLKIGIGEGKKLLGLPEK